MLSTKSSTDTSVNSSSQQKIESISQYLSYIEEHNDDDDQELLFRGQREDFPLLPKIARLNTRENILISEQKMLDEFKRKIYTSPLCQDSGSTFFSYVAAPLDYRATA